MERENCHEKRLKNIGRKQRKKYKKATSALAGFYAGLLKQP